MPNMLVEKLGDSANLKILGFLIEHPFTYYTKVEIKKFTNVEQREALKCIDLFIEKGYMKMYIRESDWVKVYKTNLQSNTIKNLLVFIESVGEYDLTCDS